MRSVIITEKTVDEAINVALKQLDATLDEVDIEILEEGSRGLLGIIGAKNAVVRVSLPEPETGSVTRRIVAESLDRDSFEENLAQEAKAHEDRMAQAKENAEKAREIAPPEEEPVEETETVELEEEPEEETFEEEVPEEEVIEEPDFSYEEEFEEEIDIFPDEEEEEAMMDDSIYAEELVTVSKLDDPQLTLEEKAQMWLSQVLEEMKIQGDLITELKDQELSVELVNITSEDTGIVVGRRAETLDSLQYLLSIVINRYTDDYVRVYLDVGGYRERRKKSIEKMALRQAKKVQNNKKAWRLEPMNAYERRIVHCVLQDVEGIETDSEGRDPYRKVVIRPKKD